MDTVSKPKNKLWQLFQSTLLISAFTFGGGYVIVPLMKKRFVDELRWLEEEETLDFIAIAQSAPGAVAVNASILLGYRIAGLPGALVAILGTILPPMITLSPARFFGGFRSSVTFVNGVWNPTRVATFRLNTNSCSACFTSG